MRDNKGFTLIELLIVVVIIGILAAIAIPKFSATREKAFVSTIKSDLKNLATQREFYHNTAFSYGTTPAILGASVSDGVTITINEVTGAGCDCVPCGCRHRALRHVPGECGGRGWGPPVRWRGLSPARLRAETQSLHPIHPWEKLESVFLEDVGVENLRRLTLFVSGAMRP